MLSVFLFVFFLLCEK